MTQAFHGGALEEAAQEFDLPINRLIDFSSNINPFAPVIAPEQWLDWQSEITRYPEVNAGGLQQQLAHVYRLHRQQVLPTSGGIEALYLAARLFTGKKVAVIEPSFSDYTRAFEAAGETPKRVALPMKAWTDPMMSWADHVKFCDVVVFGNPNNPTGAFQSLTNVMSVLKQPWARAISWIIDEAFIEFVSGGDRESLLRNLPENVLVLRSLTKSWGLPGLRLGFLATSNVRWMEQLRRMQAPWSINAVAQAWARSVLTLRNHARLLSGLQELHQVKMNFQSQLDLVGGLRVVPSSANFFLIQIIDALLSSDILYQRLGQRGLIVRRCDSFYELPKGCFLRVAVKTPEENGLLTAALSEICTDLIRRAA